MSKRSVIVELRYNKDLAQLAFSDVPAHEKALDTGSIPKVPGTRFDQSFAPTRIPGMIPRTALQVPYVSGAKFDLATEPEESTYIVRAYVDENQVNSLSEHADVVGVFADVEIQPAIICPGSPALGTDADVERLLCASQLKSIGMDATGVLVAIVDTGFNLAYLAAHGKTITLDAARSWVPSPGMIPGNAPVSHGTMCAFDAAIAAPNATFLDIQVLRSSATGPTPMSGVLSDAVRAYSHLYNVMTTPRRPGEHRSMVVSNSWGMFHPTWDAPVGNPANYSDNPNHPFNRIVGALEQAGADILFAAGNCGCDCPDSRCQGLCRNAIYGANGHPSVLTIGGVDITKARVGYSTQGPGRLSSNKPDLCGFTHFRGSGVYGADGGTSAATPVVAGVVASVRTKRPYEPGNPAASPSTMRALMRSTAEDRGTAGFDFDYGFGVVGGCEIYRQFRPIERIDICRLFPSICRPIPDDICVRFPALCRRLPDPRIPFPPIPPRPPFGSAAGTGGTESRLDPSLEDLLLAAWQAGYEASQEAGSTKAADSAGSGGCHCRGSK